MEDVGSAIVRLWCESSLSPTLCCKACCPKFFPFDVVDACDHCDLVVVHLVSAVVACDVCVCACIACSPVSVTVEVMDVDVVDLVVDVNVEPRGAGKECSARSCLSCSRAVVGDVATIRKAGATAAAAAAAVRAAGERENLLEEDVAVAVAAAAAVVAAVATAYLKVLVQAGCDVEAEAKVGTAKPGGKRGCSP